MTAPGWDEVVLPATLTWPTLAAPLGRYQAVVLRGPCGVVGGQFPRRADGDVIRGRLGAELDTGAGREAARLAALHLLAQLRAAVPRRALAGLLRLDGFVAAAPGWDHAPAVLDGASELLVDVLGDAGVHARTAVLVHALPLGAPIELSASFLVA